jgi:meso-butanediol dehydrogenase / (S,S)-butanediol dehydrogenase / diacetyl reductase
MNFANQTVLVTGGASGMGAACVRAFVASGAQVVLIDKNQTLAAEVSSQTGAMLENGDVSSSEFCDSVVARAAERFGRVDVLVNAAGIIVRALGVETSDEAWQRIMNVNVTGTFFMARAALRQMGVQQSGAVINFGSIWGDVGAAGVAAYCASKGAIHNLTRALALEHAGMGIRVNAVCPGEVNTPMLQSERAEAVSDALLERLAATVPMGRLAAPEEIAQVVLFLASSQASYMTGSLVMVDGGFIAR